MAPKDSKIKADAKRKQAEYAKQRRHRVIINCLGYSLVAVVFALLVMILAGERFDSTLRTVGLRGIANAMSGLYRDCSKPENQGKGFCEQPPPPSSKHWNDVKKRGTTYNIQFSLD